MGNHNSGRRPKPTALKLLQGNPGKRKLNELEPKPPEGESIPHEEVSRLAQKVWDEVGPICLYMGTLTPADVSSFATFCELEATRRVASKQKDAEGFTPFLMTTITDSAGNEHPKVQEHPAIKLERNTAAALRPYYEKFGLEPVSRARLVVNKNEEPKSKWAELA